MEKAYTQSSLLGNEPEESSEENRTDSVRPSRRRANDLDGKTWLRYSISVWSDIRKSSKETELGHPAIFPTELVSRLIRIFTNSEQRVVLDPFAGMGSTLVAAQNLGKDGIGIELNPEFAEKARLRCEEKELFDTVKKGNCLVHNDNALSLRKYVSDNSVDLVVTSPPYWDILNAN